MSHTNCVLTSKRTVLFTPQAAGSSTLSSSVLDMQGFESVVFETLIGALTTGQTLATVKVQGGNLANGSDLADLAGASITVADADTGKLEVIEIFRPQYRYLKLVITRTGQQPAISSVVMTQHHSHKPAESDDATTVAQTLLCVEPSYTDSAKTVTSTTYGGSTTKVSTTARTSS